MQKRKLLLFLIAAVGTAVSVILVLLKYSVSYDEDNVFYHSDETFLQSGVKLVVTDTPQNISASDAAPEERVNINTATVYELADKLPGIGKKKAQAIVEYREITGGFRSVDELIEVDGIGEKTLEALRPYCYIE